MLSSFCYWCIKWPWTRFVFQSQSLFKIKILPWNVRLRKFPLSLSLYLWKLSVATLLFEREETALRWDVRRSVLSYSEGREQPGIYQSLVIKGQGGVCLSYLVTSLMLGGLLITTDCSFIRSPLPSSDGPSVLSSSCRLTTNLTCYIARHFSGLCCFILNL